MITLNEVSSNWKRFLTDSSLRYQQLHIYSTLRYVFLQFHIKRFSKKCKKKQALRPSPLNFGFRSVHKIVKLQVTISLFQNHLVLSQIHGLSEMGSSQQAASPGESLLKVPWGEPSHPRAHPPALCTSWRTRRPGETQVNKYLYPTTFLTILVSRFLTSDMYSVLKKSGGNCKK